MSPRHCWNALTRLIVPVCCLVFGACNSIQTQPDSSQDPKKGPDDSSAIRTDTRTENNNSSTTSFAGAVTISGPTVSAGAKVTADPSSLSKIPVELKVAAVEGVPVAVPLRVVVSDDRPAEAKVSVSLDIEEPRTLTVPITLKLKSVVDEQLTVPVEFTSNGSFSAVAPVASVAQAPSRIEVVCHCNCCEDNGRQRSGADASGGNLRGGSSDRDPRARALTLDLLIMLIASAGFVGGLIRAMERVQYTLGKYVADEEHAGPADSPQRSEVPSHVRLRRFIYSYTDARFMAQLVVDTLIGIFAAALLPGVLNAVGSDLVEKMADSATHQVVFWGVAVGVATVGAEFVNNALRRMRNTQEILAMDSERRSKRSSPPEAR